MVTQFSTTLGLINSLLWIGILLAEVISLLYPKNNGEREILRKEMLIAALIGIIVWRCGLVVTSYALPFIDRGSVSLYIRLLDFAVVWIVIVRFFLVVRALTRQGYGCGKARTERELQS